MLPFTVNNLVEATVSMRRLQQFLSSAEIDKDAVNRLPAPHTAPMNGDHHLQKKDEDGTSIAISVKNGTFTWGKDLQKSKSYLFLFKTKIATGL